jgi:hypothetical protein
VNLAICVSWCCAVSLVVNVVVIWYYS